jgi:transcriptional regulator with XRE-family HTH domain
VAQDGKAYFTQSETARLAGVSEQAVSKYFNNLSYNYIDYSSSISMFYSTTKNQKYILDIDVADYIATQAMKGNKKAILTMTQFLAVGLRVAAQMESGYHNKQAETLRITTDELLELREKRKFESINENTAKAILKERNNNKVHDLPLVAIELGLIEIVDIEKKYKAQIPTAMGTELGLTMNRNVIYYPKSLHPVLKSEVAVKRWIAQRMEDQESIFDD